MTRNELRIGLIVGMALGIALAGFGAGWLVFHPRANEAAQATSASRRTGLDSPTLEGVVPEEREPRGLADAITPTKSVASFADILKERDPGRRITHLEQYLNSLNVGEYAGALKDLRRLPGSNERELASRLLVARWVHADLEGALQFAASNNGYEHMADPVFEQLAADDTTRALERARTLPDQDLRYSALRGVLGYMAANDPSGAIALARSFDDLRGHEPLSLVVYREWARRDPQAAAMQAAQDSHREGWWRSPVGQVVRNWASTDPAAAANFALNLSDSTAQTRSVAQVVRQWSRDNPIAAANWTTALPAGTPREAAVAAYARSVASTDLEAAMSWLGMVTNETIRNETLHGISREIMWRDPKHGVARLQAAGVPPNFTVPPERRRPPGG